MKNYPIIDEHRKHYVRTPIQVTHGLVASKFDYLKPGQWIAVDVLLPRGYQHLVAPNGLESEEECQKACDIHNKYHGWTEKEVEEIISKSMELSPKQKEAHQDFYESTFPPKRRR